MQRSRLVPKYGSRWALMWTNSFLKHTHARIRVRFRCPGTRHKRGHRAPVCTRLYNHCKSHVFFFFLNYVWQGGNGVTMYTVTYRVLTVWTRHHFGPVRRQWFLVNVDSPWEMKQNVRISRTEGYNFCLIGLLWVFRCWYLLKILNAMGRRGGGGEGAPDFKLRGWLKDFWGVEIFDYGIFLVSISFTWGFFAFSLMK